MSGFLTQSNKCYMNEKRIEQHENNNSLMYIEALRIPYACVMF